MNDNPEDDLSVRLPSGAEQPVLTAEEAEYLRRTVSDYDEAFKLVNVADAKVLDRIMMFELQLHRYGQWIGRGADYHGEPVDTAGLGRDMLKISLELRGTLKMIGLDKVTRDKQMGIGSLHKYIENLLIRAKAFGIHRNRQADRAMELLSELLGMVTFYRNASPRIRKEFAHTAEDILTWVWETMRPEFEELDNAFREEQKLWIREM